MEVCSTAARDSATAGWAFEDEEWQDENGSSPTGAPDKTPHVTKKMQIRSTDCYDSLMQPNHMKCPRKWCMACSL